MKVRKTEVLAVANRVVVRMPSAAGAVNVVLGGSDTFTYDPLSRPALGTARGRGEAWRTPLRDLGGRPGQEKKIGDRPALTRT